MERVKFPPFFLLLLLWQVDSTFIFRAVWIGTHQCAPIDGYWKNEVVCELNHVYPYVGWGKVVNCTCSADGRELVVYAYNIVQTYPNGTTNGTWDETWRYTLGACQASTPGYSQAGLYTSDNSTLCGVTLQEVLAHGGPIDSNSGMPQWARGSSLSTIYAGSWSTILCFLYPVSCIFQYLFWK